MQRVVIQGCEDGDSFERGTAQTCGPQKPLGWGVHVEGWTCGAAGRIQREEWNTWPIRWKLRIDVHNAENLHDNT